MIFLYIFVIGFVFKDYWNGSDKRKNVFLWFVSFIPLFIVAGLRREDVGTDTANYLRGFRGIRDTPIPEIFELERWEPAYVLLNKLAGYFSDNDQIILIVTSFIFLIGILYFIKKNSPHVVLSLYLFISLYLYLFSFNVIRQAIAMSLVAAGFHLIQNRKFKTYIFVVLVAALFHESAIILLPLYFLYGMRFSFKNVALISLLFLVLSLSIEFVVFRVLTYSNSLAYLMESDISEGAGFLFPVINLSVFTFILFIKLINKHDIHVDFFLFISALGLFTSLLSMNLELLLRLNYYFLVYYIVGVPYVLSIVKERKLRFLLSYILVAVTISYFMIRLFAGWHGVTPYYTF